MKNETHDNPEFPKDPCPTGSGKMFGYTVEARNNSARPITLGNQTFDIRWKKVNYIVGPVGVPNTGGSVYEVGTYGVLTYEAAQALRWWIHADANREGGYCLETRLVEHEIKFEFSVRPIDAYEYVGYENNDVYTSSRGPKKDKK